MPKTCSSYEMCKEILDELIRLRLYHHMSQQELAARSGVGQSMINRFEHGINTPNMKTIIKLLAVFGKTLYICDKADKYIEYGRK